MRIVPAEGAAIDIGTVEENPTIGIIDYSRRVTDDFGVTTVVKRDFSRRLTCRLALPFDEVDGFQQQLADLRATSAQWIADDRFAWLQPTGFYKEFSIDLNVPPLSFCTLTVEGLAESEAAPDSGADPAPDLATSTLQLLRPVTITDAILASSSVPESDAPAWAAGVVYPLDGRVIKAASHRVFQSLVAGNVGHDPDTSPSQWADIGPTNRWAMFDEALGTVTSATGGSIVVSVNAGAIGAIALLDVVGTSAQVEVFAPGNPVPVYNRTLAADGGSIRFLDLPKINGTAQVTLTGTGTVSIGTLLVGELVGLGLTEASPSSGITDYSRKVVDDFGGVTIVQRAWAKKATANALIRTDAVDVVADRIASVRARPVLWIGDSALDSLSVYGFFRDFSIEVGETVSKLSLSIEGLSKAKPLPAPWEAEIQQLQDSLNRIASDSLLNAGEKPQAIIDFNALGAQLTALNNRYVAIGSPSDLTAAHDDAGTKFGTLSAYLTSLTPAWTDTTQDTPIVPATYQTRWIDAYTAVATFTAAITGRQGGNGVSGQTLELVKIYKRAPAGSPPATPTTTSTFNFSSYSISSIDNGWTIGVPPANGQPLYVSAASAVVTPPATTDTIAAGEWTAPVIDSQDGQPGANAIGGLTVVLYSRNSTGAPPATPSAALNVDLLTGTITGTLGVWSAAAPDPAGGRYLYQTTAAALATAPSTTATIAPSTWAAAKQILQDGLSPPAGLTVELVKIYKRAASAPATPTATSTFDFSTYSISGLNSGWTLAVPAANGQPLYVSAAPAIATAPATTDTIAPGEWASPVIDSQDGQSGQNGGNGTGGFPVLIFQRNNTGTAPAAPTSTLTFDFATGVLSGTLGGWTQFAPDPSLGKFLFQTSAPALATAPATTDTIAPGEWAAVKQIVKDGDDGLSFTLTVASIEVPADYLGTAKATAFPINFSCKLTSGSADMSAAATFTVPSPSGNNAAKSSQTDVTITAASADGYIDVRCQYGAFDQTKRVPVTLKKDAAPAQQGFTSQTTNSLGNFDTAGGTNYPSGPPYILTVMADGAGQLNGTFAFSYDCPIPDDFFARSCRAAAKMVYRIAGSGGSWLDLRPTNAEVVGFPSTSQRVRTPDDDVRIDHTTGTCSDNYTRTGLAAGQTYEMGLLIRNWGSDSVGVIAIYGGYTGKQP